MHWDAQAYVAVRCDTQACRQPHARVWGVSSHQNSPAVEGGISAIDQLEDATVRAGCARQRRRWTMTCGSVCTLGAAVTGARKASTQGAVAVSELKAHGAQGRKSSGGGRRWLWFEWCTRLAGWATAARFSERGSARAWRHTIRNEVGENNAGDHGDVYTFVRGRSVQRGRWQQSSSR